MPKSNKSLATKRSTSKSNKKGGGGFKIWDVGTGAPLGNSAPQDWQPTEICYYKLCLAAQAGIHFEFGPTSGYVNVNLPSPLPNPPNQDPLELHNVLRAAVAGMPPTVTPFDVKAGAPNIIVKNPCYIVIELDSAINWRFLHSQPAISIGTNHVPSGKPADAYFSLNHFDTDGLTTGYEKTSTTPGKPGAPDINRTCRLICFGMKSRQLDPNDRKSAADRFNIYLEVDNGFGQLLPIILDPDIKNEGGSIPPILSPIGRSRRKRSPKKS